MVDMTGAGVVVTGAGHGIGRAIAHRLAAEGARVMVNDVDADAAHTVATEISGFSATGDATSEAGVATLLDHARTTLGTIDVYCANAGIAAGEGPDTDEATWQRAWETNVLAHVRASRALLPEWLERGDGRFIVTASAAGLLTALGSAPYSVTKHGAVSYAEWLSATYGHRGVAVHCLCPQGVRTQMLEDSGAMGEVLLRPTAIEPEQVADALWAGIVAEQFLILPHPEVGDYYTARAGDTDRWLRGMRTLQQRIDGRSD